MTNPKTVWAEYGDSIEKMWDPKLKDEKHKIANISISDFEFLPKAVQDDVLHWMAFFAVGQAAVLKGAKQRVDEEKVTEDVERTESFALSCDALGMATKLSDQISRLEATAKSTPEIKELPEIAQACHDVARGFATIDQHHQTIRAKLKKDMAVLDARIDKCAAMEATARSINDLDKNVANLGVVVQAEHSHRWTDLKSKADDMDGLKKTITDLKRKVDDMDGLKKTIADLTEAVLAHKRRRTDIPVITVTTDNGQTIHQPTDN